MGLLLPFHEKKRPGSQQGGECIAPGLGKSTNLVFDLDGEDAPDDEEDEGGGRPMAALQDSDLFTVDDGPTLPRQTIHQYLNTLRNQTPSLEMTENPPHPNMAQTLINRRIHLPLPHHLHQHLDPHPQNYVHNLKNQHRRIHPPPLTILLFPAVPRVCASCSISPMRMKSPKKIMKFGYVLSLNPEPSWAQRARKRNREEREAKGILDEDNKGEGIEADKKNLFTSTNGILRAAEKRRTATVVPPSGTLSIERLRDANLSTQNTVSVVSFHPSD